MRHTLRLLALAPLLGTATTPAPSAAQDSTVASAVEPLAARDSTVTVITDDHPLASRIRMARVDRSRGFAALWVGVLDAWGWTLDLNGQRARATGPDGTLVHILADTPYVRSGASTLQLAHAPYEKEDNLFVPMQLVFELGGWPVEGDPRPTRPLAPPTPIRRLVVIDPGHGGDDPGVVGVDGAAEKDVALGLAAALAEELADDPLYDVRLTRDEDVFVPLADRGAVATALSGSAPAVFLSLHANLDPGSGSTRGFETFVLGSAREEDHQRLAEMENAASKDAQVEDGLPAPGSSSMLDRMRSHGEPWSSRLAGLIQTELQATHPGAPRGVAHAPLAVLEDALMPSAFVEIGYLSNRREAELVSDPAFQARAAQAMARAIDDFFVMYPAANRWAGMSGRP